MRDRRSEVQTDFPTEGGEPRRRYPPPPRPGARAARAARAVPSRQPKVRRSEDEDEDARPSNRGPSAGVSGERDDAHDDSPTLPAMVGIVALSVALIILVSFAAGYGFGHLFL